MKKLAYLVFCAALLAALSGVITVYAQDAVDPASLDYIAKAYSDTLASTSLHIESQSQTESAAQQQGTNARQKQTAAFDAAKTTDSWNISGTRTISITLPNNELDITLDTIIVDGTIYARVSGMPQQANTQFTIPEGWFDVTQLEASGQRVPGIGLGDAKSTVLTLLDALNLPVNTQSVTTLSELPADKIGDQSMRVFQLALDPQTILDSDAAGLLRGRLGGGFGFFGGGRPGQGGQGQNGNGTAPQGTLPADGAFPTPQPPNPADYQITFAVYIGDQDHLIHRIYSVVAIAAAADNGSGFGGQPARTITTVTDFSKFNEPVTITAPEITSS